MSQAPTGVAANPLLTLLDLGHRARAAAGMSELGFMLVNDTRLLVPYRQAALWFSASGITALSGVMQPDSNAPYAQWLQKVCAYLVEVPEAAGAGASRPRRVGAGSLPPELAAEWKEWLPAEALWIALPAGAGDSDSGPGGLLLAGETPFGDDCLPVVEEWLLTWHHAWLARFKASAWAPGLWRRKWLAWRARHRTRAWWRRRPNQILLALLLILLLPVRLTVLAPGELVAADPATLRAPLDGVIGQFHVTPNETVKKGQLLFSFDEAPIASRLEVARQVLVTAEAEYRQFAQMALSDPKSKAQLALVAGKIGEKRAEEAFLSSQLERSRVVSPQDGIAIFDDPSEWIGRPVQTGERVMRIARPEDAEIEAWVAIGDAIPLEDGASVNLYLASSPFAAVSGRLRYLSHDAGSRPDGTYAYRARARLEPGTALRIGLKGTAKLRGGWVPLGYWMLRRPLASIRQFLAI